MTDGNISVKIVYRYKTILTKDGEIMKLNRNKLLLAMANACITDNELCEKSSVSKPAFAKIKANRQNPKPVTIGKLARALNVSVEELIESEA